MKRAVSIALATALVALFGTPAWAQVARTFVSGTGMDTNPCTRAAPCRSFGQAISVTNAGGEVVVLDSAGYGPFNISKAISISAQGVEAAITVPNGSSGIVIAVGANDVVNLRSLVITGSYNGTNGDEVSNGIFFSTGGTLNIQNCVVRNLPFAAIYMQEGASAVTISDTILSNNGSYGVRFAPTATSSLSLERVQVLSSTIGLYAPNFANSGVTLSVNVDDSAFVGNSGSGVLAVQSSASAPTTVMLSNSQIFNNGTGVNSGATINLAQDTLFGNTTGFDASGGAIRTFRTTVNGVNYNGNYIVDTTNAGSLTPLAPQ